jgi:hypothetical protein
LKAAAAAATAAVPAGWLWQPRPGGVAAPKVGLGSGGGGVRSDGTGIGYPKYPGTMYCVW